MNTLKAISFLSILCLIIMGICKIKSNYEYENEINSYWHLADKSSTITEKAKYINLFCAALESSKLSGQHNALFFKTPDNSFNMNYSALLSLKERLNQIEKMDVKSFEYNTAIQQITQQEQGEASLMLAVFNGCWIKEHYFLLWDNIGFGLMMILLVTSILPWAWLIKD